MGTEGREGRWLPSDNFKRSDARNPYSRKLDPVKRERKAKG